MTAFSTHQGYEIYYDEERESWCYVDNDVPIRFKQRPCPQCGKSYGVDGHDPCLGRLPGVINACCGHGGRCTSYIQFENGVTIEGKFTAGKE